MRSWGEGGEPWSSLRTEPRARWFQYGFSGDSEVGAHALDAPSPPAAALVRWLGRLGGRVGELRRCTPHLAIDDRVANGAARRGSIAIDSALLARQIGLRQIGRVHHDDVLAAVDSHDANGRERVPVGARQID